MQVENVDIKNANIKEVAEKYSVDEDLLFDVQDQSESARYLEKEGYTEIILKYPAKNDISTIGVYLTKEKAIFFHTESFPFAFRPVYKNTRTAVVDVVYKISEGYFKMLKNIDKKIRKIKRDSKANVKNSDMLSLFELQNDLDDCILGIKGNLSVLSKIMVFMPNNEFVFDAKIENDQALETALSYSKTVSNLKTTLEIITNNLTNKRMESLTIVNVSALIITSISGLYGMNVKLPFSEKEDIFFYIILVSIVLAVNFGIFLKKKFSEKR